MIVQEPSDVLGCEGIVTHAGNNNLHSKSPTVNGLITGLLTFSLTAHVKSTRAHTLLHHVSLLFICITSTLRIHYSP